MITNKTITNMKHVTKILLLAFLTTCIPFTMLAADIPATPVTASTDAAKNLYAYFYDQYGRKAVSSVMADVNWNNTCAEKVYQRSFHKAQNQLHHRQAATKYLAALLFSALC